MDKAYIKKKIENCQGLVDNATSDAQREVYQGYLDFWTEKLPKSQRPDIIAEKLAASLIKQETERSAKEAAEKEKAKAEFEAQLQASKAEREAEAVEKRKAEIKAELAELEYISARNALDEPEPEELNEINFELLYPNKKAYRTQNGERIETIAYKEYLNKTESE